MRLSDFIAMAEGRTTFIRLVQLLCVQRRVEGIDSIVADPRGALVRLAEASDAVGVVEILETVTVLARLGRPHVLGIRHRRGWEGVAVREAEVGVRSLQGIDVLHEVWLCLCRARQDAQGKS